jgi:hypothetical protein
MRNCKEENNEKIYSNSASDQGEKEEKVKNKKNKIKEEQIIEEYNQEEKEEEVDKEGEKDEQLKKSISYLPEPPSEFFNHDKKGKKNAFKSKTKKKSSLLNIKYKTKNLKNKNNKKKIQLISKEWLKLK